MLKKRMPSEKLSNELASKYSKVGTGEALLRVNSTQRRVEGTREGGGEIRKVRLRRQTENKTRGKSSGLLSCLGQPA